MRRKYRSHVGVLLDILETIDSEGKVVVSRIIMLANIPYDRLKPYLDKLVNEGYIRMINEENKSYYEITEKGYKLLNELRVLKKIFEKLGLIL